MVDKCCHPEKQDIDIPCYKIHYQGFNSKPDDWVMADCIMQCRRTRGLTSCCFRSGLWPNTKAVGSKKENEQESPMRSWKKSRPESDIARAASSSPEVSPVRKKRSGPSLVSLGEEPSTSQPIKSFLNIRSFSKSASSKRGRHSTRSSTSVTTSPVILGGGFVQPWKGQVRSLEFGKREVRSRDGGVTSRASLSDNSPIPRRKTRAGTPSTATTSSPSPSPLPVKQLCSTSSLELVYTKVTKGKRSWKKDTSTSTTKEVGTSAEQTVRSVKKEKRRDSQGPSLISPRRTARLPTSAVRAVQQDSGKMSEGHDSGASTVIAGSILPRVKPPIKIVEPILTESSSSFGMRSYCSMAVATPPAASFPVIVVPPLKAQSFLKTSGQFAIHGVSLLTHPSLQKLGVHRQVVVHFAFPNFEAMLASATAATRILVRLCRYPALTVPASEAHPKELKLTLNDRHHLVEPPAPMIQIAANTERFVPAIEIPVSMLQSHENTISVEWTVGSLLGEPATNYLLFIERAERKTIPAALAELRSREISMDGSIAKLYEVLTAKRTNGRGHSLAYSLLCPLSQHRMVDPTRGRECKHVECFDGEVYITANVRGRPEWICPLCRCSAGLDDLIVDQCVRLLLEFTEHEKVLVMLHDDPSNCDLIVREIAGAFASSSTVAVGGARNPPAAPTRGVKPSPIMDRIPVENVLDISSS
ncbi:hypothetical protein BV898_05300 [Hypsibius exemplaris]|uniref:SP-RING-type domain-containing protein n=1 Tax=Hypsibius exemplaris TaxID=2072580 RepID=A0A1W0WZX1_HYPEX|nr:hypothetical protein BV898_05300 [Hypsibius exemplaris]